LEEVGKVESCPLALRAQVFNGKDEGVVSKHGKPPKKPMESLKFFSKPFFKIYRDSARCQVRAGAYVFSPAWCPLPFFDG